MKTCINCDYEITKSYKFCPHCGLRLRNAFIFILIRIINTILTIFLVGIIMLFVVSFIIE